MCSPAENAHREKALAGSDFRFVFHQATMDALAQGLFSTSNKRPFGELGAAEDTQRNLLASPEAPTKLARRDTSAPLTKYKVEKTFRPVSTPTRDSTRVSPMLAAALLGKDGDDVAAHKNSVTEAYPVDAVDAQPNKVCTTLRVASGQAYDVYDVQLPRSTSMRAVAPTVPPAGVASPRRTAPSPKRTPPSPRRTAEERFSRAQAEARCCGKDPSLKWKYDENDELQGATCGGVTFSREELVQLSSCWAAGS